MQKIPFMQILSAGLSASTRRSGALLIDVEFKFTDPILGETMITPASQKCGGWRVSSSTPNDLTLADTPPSDVLFDADDIEFALCLVAIPPNRSLSVPPRRATFSSPNLSDLQHNPK